MLNAESAMAPVYDRDEPLPGDPPDPDDFDFSELRCPQCGCNDIVVDRLPEDGRRSWWGSGRAVCQHCGRGFSVVADEN
jgi:hypothetical protein